MEIDLVVFDETFLYYTYKWVSDSEIQFLIQSPPISIKNQQIWYQNLKNRVDYKIWGIIVNNTPIGACGLKSITNQDAEYWGYIGEKGYWGKGYGSEILLAMEKEARILNLKSIWLKVIDENIRAINLYTKSNFIIEKESNNIKIMRKLL